MKAVSVKREKITHFLDGVGVSLSTLKLIEKDEKSEVYRHPHLGRVFVIGGEIQHVEAWAPLYHEPLVHLPASFVREVRDVLILGGGTLYAASEALKYESVKRVLLVEKDRNVVRLAAAHYEHAARCLTDPRLVIVHSDAYQTLDSFKGEFDLVLNDGTPLLPLSTRFCRTARSPSAFSKMERAARREGVCADMMHRHLFEKKSTVKTLKLLRSASRAAVSLVFIPEYHGVLHALTMWGSKFSKVSQHSSSPTNRLQQAWVEKREGSPCTYFDPRFLPYYLYLPSYFKHALGLRKKGA